MRGNGQVSGILSNIDDRREKSTQQIMMIPDATLQSDYGVSMQLMGLNPKASQFGMSNNDPAECQSIVNKSQNLG